MKALLISAICTMLAVGSVFAQPPQVRTHGTAGDVYAVTIFNGLSNISISNFNGGFGLRYFVMNGVSLRGTIGGKVTTGGETVEREVGASGAMLIDLTSGKHNNLYLGPTLAFTHTGLMDDKYTIGGVMGVELCNFLADGLNFGIEFPLTVTTSTLDNTKTWEFGKTSGEIILSLKL